VAPGAVAGRLAGGTAGGGLRGGLLAESRHVLGDPDRDAGDTSLELNVFGHNQVAINLYDSLGYQATDQTRDLALH